VTRHRLDDLVHAARRLDVRAEHARAQVDELGRWARIEPAPRPRWVPWLAATGLAAAAVVLVLVLARPPTQQTMEATAPMRIGDRVALIVAPGTSYRIGIAEAARTEIIVERGAITARLWPGSPPHALTLRGHDVTARALGTVYTLAVDERGARVEVHEGRVEVQRGEHRALVSAGATWPADTLPRYAEAARELLAMSALPPSPLSPHSRDALAVADAGAAPAEDDAPDHAADDPASAETPGSGARPTLTRPSTPAATPAATSDTTPTPSPRERWRLARLLRGQGDYPAAIAHCEALADARDAVWSPIAIVEATRIELGPLTSPERAIAWADRFAREWPRHELAAEVRELRCRALRQLGRATECAAP